MFNKARSWMVSSLVVGAIALTAMLVGLFTTSSPSIPPQASEQNTLGAPKKDQSTKAVSSAETADAGSMQPPRAVKRLCENRGEQEFVSPSGQHHTFYESAAAVQRCEDGAIWKAVENGAKVNDAATFYFDSDGELQDICQVMFWRSGCTKFQRISCDPTNYCEIR